MTVTNFPSAPEAFRKRKQIANYLREIAGHIERFEVEVEPEQILLVLVGKNQLEILHCCGDSRNLLLAAQKAQYHFSCGFKRRGGNVYQK